MNFPLPPAISAYKKAFKALLPTLSDVHLSLLRAHYDAPAHVATVQDLADKCGIPSWRTVNRQYGELAKRVLEEMGYEKPKNNDGSLWLLGIVFWYEGMSMYLRPEVVRAIEELGIVGRSHK